jgi:hypothetical protein
MFYSWERLKLLGGWIKRVFNKGRIPTEITGIRRKHFMLNKDVDKNLCEVLAHHGSDSNRCHHIFNKD